MKSYAGIGSRELSESQRGFCYQAAAWLANQGWTLRTGACTGADQAFANGALSVGGAIHLSLPWPSYEQAWVDDARLKGAEVRVLRGDDDTAYESVNEFHPAPFRLSQAARKLHARNGLILDDVSMRFVLAYPGLRLGGTGQGIRIAEACGIEVIRLDIDEQRARVEHRIGFTL